jgi:hypothetical protein
LSPAEAAQQVYDCLLQMGAAGSNPVLEVIPADTLVVEEKHYPDPWLGFNGGPLRAYYHCHPQPTRIDGEHGHFHLFTLTAPGQWTHLGALSMDPQGQPRALFSTNRWVTDESWLPAEALQRLPLPELDWSVLSLVERWLYAMLSLFHDQFIELWSMRDHRLREIIATHPQEDMLENRKYYVLSQIPIELLSRLEAALAAETD